MRTDKKPFNHDISETVKTTFEETWSVLSCPKHELVEAMILAFAALPAAMQDDLISKRPGVADKACQILKSLEGIDLAARGLKQGRDLRRRAHQTRVKPKSA